MIPVTKIFRGERTVHNRKGGPLVVWNITSCCNLECGHCYRDSGPSAKAAELSDEKCISLAAEIAELKPPVVLLTGGEPLLRKNVFDIVKECKSKGLRVGLSTNGTLIDGETAERISLSGIDYVGISIDGKKDLHDKFRGKRGSFDASWAAIKLLNGLGVKTGVRFTITDKNKGDLDDILKQTVNAGTKRFCLYHLVYSGRAQKELDMNIGEKKKYMDKFFKAVKKISEADPNFDVLTTDSPADGVFMAKLFGADVRGAEMLSCILSHGGCSAGERVAYIDSTGNIYPCQFLQGESLGNVKEKPLLDIWNNKGNGFLNKLRNKKELLEGKCGKCAHKDICGGCRARALAYHGSLWAEDPGCYLSDNEIQEKI
ncbi:MAG: radical SAM protein [Candidatus Omnitrophica bacterium]|nr:radical SAM protein [Candidatus Omnitrophota bacterium]